MKPWEPQKGESLVAFKAWCEFVEMGEDRSVRAVAQRLNKSATLIARWSSRWGWVERIAAHEAHMAEIEQRGRERALEKKAENWATKELEMAGMLYDKAEAMLKFPLAQQRTRDGQTIIEPAKWGFRDASAMADVAVKLARLNQGEPTSISKDVSERTNEERAARILELVRPAKTA